MKVELKHPLSRSLRSLGALVGLFAYLWVATPLPPAVFAWLASLDGSHRVKLAQRDQSIEVVLCHDDQSPTRTPQHTHPRVSGALVLLAELPSGPSCDHVLNFCSCSSLARPGSRSDELTLHARFIMPLQPHAAPASGLGRGTRVVAPTIAQSRLPGEPVDSYSVFVLRTTVLLI